MRSEFESREAFECIFGDEGEIDLSKDETGEYSFQPSRFAYSFFLVAWQYRQTEVDELQCEVKRINLWYSNVKLQLENKEIDSAIDVKKIDELQKQLIEQGQRLNVQNQQIASLKWQLKRLGFTDNGGELMKPPIGDAPKFDLLNELQKQRDSFIKAYEIEMDQSIELQKRVDKAIRLLVEAELYQSEPNIDLAVQALKGGGE